MAVASGATPRVSQITTVAQQVPETPVVSSDAGHTLVQGGRSGWVTQVDRARRDDSGGTRDAYPPHTSTQPQSTLLDGAGVRKETKEGEARDLVLQATRTQPEDSGNGRGARRGDREVESPRHARLSNAYPRVGLGSTSRVRSAATFAPEESAPGECQRPTRGSQCIEEVQLPGTLKGETPAGIMLHCGVAQGPRYGHTEDGRADARWVDTRSSTGRAGTTGKSSTRRSRRGGGEETLDPLARIEENDAWLDGMARTLLGRRDHMPKDGNCLFHSLARQCDGWDSTTLRQRVVEKLADDHDLREQYVPEAVDGENVEPATYDEYVEAMARPSTYGDQRVLLVAGDILDASIWVLDAARRTSMRRESRHHTARRLLLLTFRPSHYDRLILPEQTVQRLPRL